MNSSTIPLRILIVEDDIDTAESTAALLQMDGHRVCTAYMLTTAMMAVQAENPNVVMIDIGLPGADGFAVARQLANMLPIKPLLIAYTGSGQEEYRRQAANAGFDHFLVKPADPKELQKILNVYAKSLASD